MDCIFCRIGAHEAPAHLVYEDEATVAFLDINPAARGHTLVVPKKHYTNIYELDDEAAAQVMRVSVRMARLLKQALQADGMTLAQANERAGFQSIFHVHMHVIPRWQGDGLKLPWPPRRGDDAELAALAATLRDWQATRIV